MGFVINGNRFELDRHAVTANLRGRAPEPLHTYWVEVSGVRYPVKQAFEVALGISRTDFTSQVARRQLGQLGFLTSTNDLEPITPLQQPRTKANPPQVTVDDAGKAFAMLVAFLRSGPLTTGIDQLEHALVRADRTTAVHASSTAGLTEQLLQAALVVRRDVGRVSDVIHATVISLALPVILDAGEYLTNRPSLGPGNDKSRPFDLETNYRVAEFKVAVWSSGNMMRKRGVTADLVQLALDQSGKRPELWVAGAEPIRFLQTSASPVANLLSRSSRHLRARYEGQYGAEDIPLSEFVTRHAGHVQLRNIADALPAISAALM